MIEELRNDPKKALLDGAETFFNKPLTSKALWLSALVLCLFIVGFTIHQCFWGIVTLGGLGLIGWRVTHPKHKNPDE
jgi:hypothetical protein